MKSILVFVLLSGSVLAEDRMLKSGEGTYTVSVLVKKVSSTSKDIKGKVSCPENDCEFLLAVPVKTFASSDSNRDENMKMTVESEKYPLATAKGHLSKDVFLGKGKRQMKAQVTFHNVTKEYPVTLNGDSPDHMTAEFVLKLTDHNVTRPSLFGVSVNDEVPMTFQLKWSAP